jgi:hypothetical protein
VCVTETQGSALHRALRRKVKLSSSSVRSTEVALSFITSRPANRITNHSRCSLHSRLINVSSDPLIRVIAAKGTEQKNDREVVPETLSANSETVERIPNNRRLSAKSVEHFADRRCHVVSTTDPYAVLSVF